MKLSVPAIVAVIVAAAAPAYAFAPQCYSPAISTRSSSAVFTTAADNDVPPTESATESATESETTDTSVVDDGLIPTKLPSDVGFDYVPLAGALASGAFEEADQITRDALIVIAGSKAKGRDFVYFTEVKNIPNADLATIERLWQQFSGGKFGYSVQKKKWRQSKENFDLWCKKIGWMIMDEDVERKRRWFGNSEFIYDVKKAPEGHLPLTSALRGTSLIKELMKHPVWDNDDWKKQPE